MKILITIALEGGREMKAFNNYEEFEKHRRDLEEEGEAVESFCDIAFNIYELEPQIHTGQHLQPPPKHPLKEAENHNRDI